MEVLGFLEDVPFARHMQQWDLGNTAEFLVHDDDDRQLCVNQVKWARAHTRAYRGSQH